ncbi:hypothetical protein BH11PAT1_BH11PAT1_1000 [soil metagenome]
MRYPWVALTICGIWIATLAVSFSSTVVEPTLLYIYASVTVILLFFLGFTRS